MSECNCGRRRYAASRRLPPLAPCGCIRDPVYDRHRCGRRPLSDHQVDGWRATAQHILDGGNMPIVPLEALRALYRRGGHDRQFAQELYELAGGDVA